MSVGQRDSSEGVWFKSSYSGGNATECVECAHAGNGTRIRDSKHVNGPVVHVAAGPWLTFLRSLTRSAQG
ncbi:DUF397 domain-containing protein [Streptomyces sp. enrichment culture]|uniref:DUF397 domain-containing protein n=1 Tax=Streptomyces sp. enrichment culture TaxID=1795815 RepID=UPI003F5679DE